MLLLYLNYQHSNFGISSFIYIRNYFQWYVSAKSGVKSIGNPNINYHNYKKADKFSALLMINIDTQDYELLTSYKEYSDNLAKGETSISNGITFTDKSNKAALQVFTNPKA